MESSALSHPFFRSVWVLLVVALLLGACAREEPSPSYPTYSSAPAPRERPHLVLGVHPLHNPGRLFQLYGPFIEALNHTTSAYEISLEASRDYADYERKIRSRSFELLLPNPYQTLIAQHHGYHVFAKISGDDDFRGIFLTRKDDTRLRSIQDLRGKIISYPSPTALAGGLMQQLFLQEQGVDVDKDTITHYVGSQESAIMHVALGMSDAGASWPPPWRGFQKEHPELAAQLEVRWMTPPLPNLSIMARDDLPPGLVEQLRSDLLRLAASEEGKRLLANLEFSGIEAAHDETYAVMRDFVRRFNARVRPLPLD